MKLQWREKMIEPMDELQEKARQQWQSFAPRERLILTILAALMSLSLSVLVLKEGYSFYSGHANQVETNFKNVDKIQSLISELKSQRSSLLKYERLSTKIGPDFDLNSYMQSQATKFGVSLTKTAPTRPKTGSDNSKEEWLEIQMAPTSLDSAIRFLESVEESLGIRLVELSVKPQFADPSKLDITAIWAHSKDS